MQVGAANSLCAMLSLALLTACGGAQAPAPAAASPNPAPAQPAETPIATAPAPAPASVAAPAQRPPPPQRDLATWLLTPHCGCNGLTNEEDSAYISRAASVRSPSRRYMSIRCDNAEHSSVVVVCTPRDLAEVSRFAPAGTRAIVPPDATIRWTPNDHILVIRSTGPTTTELTVHDLDGRQRMTVTVSAVEISRDGGFALTYLPVDAPETSGVGQAVLYDLETARPRSAEQNCRASNIRFDRRRHEVTFQCAHGSDPIRNIRFAI